MDDNYDIEWYIDPNAVRVLQRNCENEASSQLIKRKSTSTPSSDTGMAISKYAMLKTSRKERLPRTDNGHCQVEQTSREKLPDQSLVKHLEALSVQCVGIEIRISGGRYFDNVQMHYEKARIRVPATFGCYAEVSRLLLTMISLKAQHFTVRIIRYKVSSSFNLTWPHIAVAAEAIVASLRTAKANDLVSR
ncbi:hypothetical protein VTP01DRAFT_4589 [Rhizomucor pusillus]|uniref:uncharacterized protein n=1 Tax=Rhizomucor pusillus TaxID=4840 RepID=UPI0037422C09